MSSLFRWSRSLSIAAMVAVLTGCPVAEPIDSGVRDSGGDVRADRVDVQGGDTNEMDTGGGDASCGASETSCGGRCVDLQTDKNNCGSCGHACAGTEVCTDGMCGSPCPTGQSYCGGACVDLQFNSANCGRCGMACPSGQVCAMGACTAMCPAGRRGCMDGFATVCADLQTDSQHCGACGNACAAGQSCSAGSCSVMCTMGLTQCGSACVDTTSDPTNCGSCGNACAAGQTCMGSSCIAACSAGQVRCGSTCVDTNSDAMNCGTCGMACPSGQVCQGGACAMNCPSGQMLCGSTCVNTNTSATNCGACGNACPTGQTCSAGSCVCAAGQSMCSGTCVDLATSAANCGACGNACPSGRMCSGGMCRLSCPSGQMACGGSCVDTMTDSSNCGSCGNACAGGQSCASGSCACPSGTMACSGTCFDLQNDPMHCGTCTRVCSAGQFCGGGTCQMTAPPNDTRAGAITIPFATASSFTLMTNTSSATHNTDPPTGCAPLCTVTNDVFYTFTLTRTELVYVDSIGSAYDTVLFFANSTGTPLTTAGVPGGSVCNDDGTAPCTLGTQSMIYARLDAGTYYIVVSGCSASGAATLHVQHLPVGNGTLSSITAMGMSNYTGTTMGTGTLTQSCGGSGPENTYYFISCPVFGGGRFSASTCGNATWDTVLDQRSATRSPVETCNDDTCGLQSAITSTLPPGAGLHTLYVDGLGGASGAYTLHVQFTPGCPVATPIACMSSCVNIDTDANNCGTCGNACGTGGTCTAGSCVCSGGRMACNNRCIDTQTDMNNCGACGNVCTTACVGGVCSPANDARANAATITFSTAETTVTGTTRGATHDAPTSCVSGAGADVWYRFTVPAREVVYFDTAGSTFDTGLLITDSTGALVTGACNDDASCTTGGFTSFNQSRVAMMLGSSSGPTTYYVAVTGYMGATGDFTLHAQHLPRTVGSFFYDTPIAGGPTNTSTTLVGTSTASSATCGGTASGEDTRWFVTCGAQQQFFSLCRSDTGATYTRQIGTTLYDPTLYMRSAQTGMDVDCNDDGMSMGGTDCRGTDGTTTTLLTAQFGSRINNVMAPRGINAVFVDERSGGSGMQYTLRYQVR